MASLLRFAVFVALCTGAVRAACPRNKAADYYRYCLQRTPLPTSNVYDPQFYMDMAGPAFSAALNTKCTQHKTKVNTCFQQFFTTPEGRGCGDPEPLTMVAQDTGGMCGAEGAGPVADALLLGVGKWSSKCLATPQFLNARYYCMQQGRPPPATNPELIQRLRCILQKISFGKAEDCSKQAMLALFMSDLTHSLNFGVKPAVATVNRILTYLRRLPS